MATRKEILEIGGREVSVSNPDKVYFPEPGYTKIDVVALLPRRRRRRAGRRAAAGRWRSSASSTGSTRSRSSRSGRPTTGPSGCGSRRSRSRRAGRPTRSSLDEAAGLAWVANLGCIDLNPHPVRADDLDHPDELRVDLDPVPGVPWSQVREVALRRARGPRGGRASSAGRRRRARAGSTSTSGSSRAGRTGRSGGRRWRWPATSSGGRPSIATSKWWKEERHGVFLDYNQNAKDRTVASAYSVRPLPDARVSFPLRWDEVADVVAEDFTLATVPGAVRGARRRRAPGSTRRSARWTRCSSSSARDEAEGLGDAPWPPNYAKQEGEPPRVQPSRKRKPDEAYEGRGKDGGPPPEVAAERAAAVAAGDRNAGLPTEWEGTRPTPTGRRKSSIPVIEIARAATKAEVNEGLERWKARHPEVVEHLEPADILTDGMRGRAYVWYRLRVNLIHVPEDERPAQEPLDPDYDPWEGYEWPDQSGQPVRAPKKQAPADGRGRRTDRGHVACLGIGLCRRPQCDTGHRRTDRSRHSKRGTSLRTFPPLAGTR